jgi:hypothetical protein
MAIASAEVVDCSPPLSPQVASSRGPFMCGLWFVRVLRCLGLHARFTQV